MNREHTVTNGVGRMEECAEHVRAKFAAEGYETQKLTVSDPGARGMLVQIRRSSAGKVGMLESLAGMGACATLKLTANGDDVKIESVGGKWLDKIAANAVSWVVLWPLFFTSIFGMWRQKELLDRVFMEAMAFYTTQRSPVEVFDVKSSSPLLSS